MWRVVQTGQTWRVLKVTSPPPPGPLFRTREQARRYARVKRAVKVLAVNESGARLVRLNNCGDHQVEVGDTRIHFYTHGAARRFFEAR